MSAIIRNLSLSQKLMIAPCLFAIFLVSIAGMLHMDVSKTALSVVLVLAFGASITINLIVARIVKGAVEDVVIAMKELSKGDLRARIEQTSQDEIGRMSNRFNGINENLRRIMVHLR